MALRFAKQCGFQLLQNTADFTRFFTPLNNRAHLILKPRASNTCNASLALLSWVVDVFLVLIHLYAFSISDRNGQMPNNNIAVAGSRLTIKKQFGHN